MYPWEGLGRPLLLHYTRIFFGNLGAYRSSPVRLDMFDFGREIFFSGFTLAVTLLQSTVAAFTRLPRTLLGLLGNMT